MEIFHLYSHSAFESATGFYIGFLCIALTHLWYLNWINAHFACDDGFFFFALLSHYIENHFDVVCVRRRWKIKRPSQIHFNLSTTTSFVCGHFILLQRKQNTYVYIYFERSFGFHIVARNKSQLFRSNLLYTD